MKVTVKDGQTLADIAVQEFGSWEAAADIARENGVAVTDTPAPGAELTLPEGTYDSVTRDHCKANGVSPATARDNGGARPGIFGGEFTEAFT